MSYKKSCIASIVYPFFQQFPLLSWVPAEQSSEIWESLSELNSLPDSNKWSASIYSFIYSEA